MNFGHPDSEADWFVVVSAAANPTWPTGNGGSVSAAPVPATAITPATQKVLLRWIIALNGFTQTTPITILKGDGTSNYLGTQTWSLGTNHNSPGNTLDMVLPSGLAISGGTAGAILVGFILLN